jgi:hypothetical protein
MSDLRFARALGTEFERLERAGHAGSPRRHARWWSARLPGLIATAAAVASSLAIAVVAVALLSHGRETARHAATSPASRNGLGFSGGNCRAPAPTGPRVPGTRSANVGADGMIRAAGGRVSGIAWQLRVKPNTEVPGSTQHARLLVGTGRYGLCSRRSVPVPFGLINAGARGIVYGYLPDGAGSYQITVSAGNTRVGTTNTDDQLFFISALPRSACAYRTLTVTAVSTPVAGLPPNITRSLNAAATHFTTTLRFAGCRPHTLVTVVSEHGQRRGRSSNAALAKVIAQVRLTARSGLVPAPAARGGSSRTTARWESSSSASDCAQGDTAFGCSPLMDDLPCWAMPRSGTTNCKAHTPSRPPSTARRS